MTNRKHRPPRIRPEEHHAWIVTDHGGNQLFLNLPYGVATSPMGRLLQAVFVRADEDIGWWEDQVKWLDEYERENVVQFRRRSRIGDGPKAA